MSSPEKIFQRWMSQGELPALGSAPGPQLVLRIHPIVAAAADPDGSYHIIAGRIDHDDEYICAPAAARLGHEREIRRISPAQDDQVTLRIRDHAVRRLAIIAAEKGRPYLVRPVRAQFENAHIEGATPPYRLQRSGSERIRIAEDNASGKKTAVRPRRRRKTPVADLTARK